MEKEILLSSAYLAPVEYYTKLYAYDKVYVERFDHYAKQTYRNRCVIASAAGPLALTIPTEKSDEQKCLMKDVRISDHGNWRHVHWNAFVAGYKHSPFFDYYADEFQEFYKRRYTFLYDFNAGLCQWICRQLDMQPCIVPTDDFCVSPEGVEDFRERIHPKKPFEANDPRFVPKPYYQVFDAQTGFLPNLSIIDLLFNMGPEGLLVLKESFYNEE
ncbi:WbqC family protein [Bacteroides sp. An19]|uniref:WbqC family protein n=1 Tax=Bacteroides sp. An19 TaxID=1965580 RepID=UPI000B38471F|nr:WbqC family protein [Bacteroides sp. An19]OUP30939.1 hypothetical protein B5F25_12905 [Bacteroides sp. An19]